jgi:5-amino-6-(5-phosphoribosylamino)uracil reductase
VPSPQRLGPDIELRELLPAPVTRTVGEVVSSLNLVDKAGPDRPYTIVNFVSSADGRAAFDGRSGQLGGVSDRAMFLGLRERVDAVFAGTGTMRTERYGRMIRDPERRRRRADSGLAPEPLSCLISRAGAIPLDIPLFDDPEARVVVFTPTDLDTSRCRAEVEVVRLDPERLTLTTMMHHLREAQGVRALLCEGGPLVFGSLLQEGLVDELFLTLAPKLAGGGTDPSVTAGPPLPELASLELVWALEDEGSLFLRYALR